LPTTDASGQFSISADVQYIYPGGVGCDWSDIDYCKVGIYDDARGVIGATADIVFAGHDTRTPAPLHHLVLAPTSASISAGGAQSFTARGADASNNDLGDLTASTTFTIVPDGSCAAASCTALVAGGHTVTGTSSGKTGTATLAVTAGALHHLVLSPATATISVGGSQSYTARGADASNNDLGDLTSSTTFSINPTGACTANSCTPTLAGTHTVTGTSSGKVGTGTLTVDDSSRADLRLIQTVSAPAVAGGSNVTFTGTVTNLGPATALSVALTDSFPAATTPVSATSSGGSCSIAGTEIACNLGDMLNGASATVTVVARTVIVGTGFENSMRIACACFDPVPANDQSSVIFSVTSASDIQVTSNAGPARAPYGEYITYTSVVRNTGLTLANVRVLDELTPSTNWLVTSAASSIGTCGIFGYQAICTMQLGAGESATIVVSFDVETVVLQELHNRVRVLSCTCVDPDPANDELFSGPISFVYQADIAAAIAGPATVRDGDAFVWTWSVENPTRLTLPEVTSTITLPANVVFVSRSPATDSCSLSGRVLTCAMANVGAGLRQSSITVRADGPGSASVSLDIVCSCVDPDLSNNHAVWTTTIRPSSDLVAHVTGPSQGYLGTDVVISGDVTNLGPSFADGVVVTILLPNWITIGPVTVPQGDCSITQPVNGLAGKVVCVLGRVPAGSTVTIRIVVVPNAVNLGPLRPQLVISCGCDDPVTGNNRAVMLPCTISPASDLGLTPIDPTGPFFPGQDFDLRFRVDNFGPSPAYGATVTIVLPPGTTVSGLVVSAGVICTKNGLTLTCRIPAIAAGNSVTITCGCRPPGPGIFPGASASVICACIDLVPGNNTGISGGGLNVLRICLPANGILFQSDRTGNRDIWVMDPNGGSVQDLTAFSPADDITAAWAPNHRRYAYASGVQGGNHHIVVVDLDASGCILRQLTPANQPLGSNAAPRWSPNSLSIAFHSDSAGNVDVWTMNGNGVGAPRRVTNSPYTDSTPTWSPNGNFIAFQSNRPDRTGTTDFEIWITRADGLGTARQLTTDSANDFGPMFAYPPSSKLVWHNGTVGGGVGSYDLFTATVDFSAGTISPPQLLTSRPGVTDGNGWFSPASATLIAFDSGLPNRPHDIWIWNGLTAVNLTTRQHDPGGLWNDEYPSW
jgi:uncharacterized repeat protein (TIGR01451 family)